VAFCAEKLLYFMAMQAQHLLFAAAAGRVSAHAPSFCFSLFYDLLNDLPKKGEYQRPAFLC